MRNLREIAPTVYYNVPKGFELLVHQLRAEPPLRRKFFSELRMNFYAGASLAQHVWDALDEMSVATTGERVVMMTGLGATETGPTALFCTEGGAGSGSIGLPCPGVTLKLVPREGKLEARVSSPSVTPGYWRDPELTAAAFDEEGFYCFNDAVRFLDPAEPARGFVFDGRLAEDFKLDTGTWVSVGPLRARFIAHFAPFARDVVITGLDRDFLGAIWSQIWTRSCGLFRPGLGRAIAGDRGGAGVAHGAARAIGDLCRDGDRLLDPGAPARGSRRAALDRRRRDHRQGLDQPARGARAPPRSRRRDLRGEAVAVCARPGSWSRGSAARMSGYRVIGKGVRRIEDAALLAGRARFVDDLDAPDALHAAFVRSPHGHALIRGIDPTAARAAPGVAAVLALADLRAVLTDERLPLQFRAAKLPPDVTPFVLAKDEVAFVGEAVAVVLAASRYLAEDAAQLVAVDYEVLPAVSDCREALAPGAPPARRVRPGNLLLTLDQEYGDLAAAFAAAAHTAKVSIKQHRGVAHPIEGRGVLAT